MGRLIVNDAVLTTGMSVTGPISSFDLLGATFGEGGFGDVYISSATKGQRSYAVKIFKVGTDRPMLLRNIRHLQASLNLYTREPTSRQRRTLASFAALHCLPVISFKGTLDNKQVYGYAANYVKAGTFDDLLKDEYDPTKKIKPYRGSSVQQRLRMALQLVEGMEFLRSIGYIHADLNAKNLLIDTVGWNLHIIDYDTGVVTTATNDDPMTWGKPNDWLAPEITAQLMRDRRSRVKVTLYTDVWSVAIAIHFLLLLVHPYGFLEVVGPKTVKNYLRLYKWPEVGSPDFIFSAQGLKQWEGVTRFFNRKSGSAPKLLPYFVTTFQDGYARQDMRTSYGQWRSVIANILYPPSTDSPNIHPGLMQRINATVMLVQEYFKRHKLAGHARALGTGIIAVAVIGRMNAAVMEVRGYFKRHKLAARAGTLSAGIVAVIGTTYLVNRAPRPAPDPQYWMVCTQSLFLRTGAGVSFDQMARLPNGTQIIRSDDTAIVGSQIWMQVALTPGRHTISVNLAEWARFAQHATVVGRGAITRNGGLTWQDIDLLLTAPVEGWVNQRFLCGP